MKSIVNSFEPDSIFGHINSEFGLESFLLDFFLIKFQFDDLDCKTINFSHIVIASFSEVTSNSIHLNKIEYMLRILPHKQKM